MSVMTTPRSSAKLTERQTEVLERIDRRVPIKVIAGDMGVSEARINQHIRALKDKFEVESMNELVDCYRAMEPQSENDEKREKTGAADPYRKPIYTNSQLPDEPIFPDQGSRNGPGNVVFSDAHHVLIDAPWAGLSEPVVVPPILDGENAVLGRMLAMIAIAFGIVAAIVLVVSAAVTMSDVLEGKAAIEAETTGTR
ncbi:MAG: LuxR C-terminal-related transcriptional regulator [Pontixanthobacter sp.]